MNMNFFEVLLDYPMGNGMGAGGTSLPFFAQQLLSQQVIMENEYARILLEQGFPGLVLFLAFAGWLFTRKINISDEAVFGKTLLWFFSAISISTAWIGIGMMSSIPGTAMLLLGIGYCVTVDQKTKVMNYMGRITGSNQSMSSLPAYQRGLTRA